MSNVQTSAPAATGTTGSAAAASPSAPPLTADHLEYLNARAVPVTVAAAAGLRSVTGEEAARLLGRKEPLNSTGLAIPYPGLVPVYHRMRIDEPQAVGGARYLAPAGLEVPIYVPPPAARVTNPNLPPGLLAALIVVESPIKALALAAAGLDAVGLGGTSTTLADRHGARQLNGSWKRVQVARRDVIICFDAGRAMNPNVARDEARLAVALRAAGAAPVSVASLPAAPGGDDQGPDDYIAAQGAAAIYQVLADAVPSDPVDRVKMHVAAGKSANDLLDDTPFLHAIIEASTGTAANAREALENAGVTKKDQATALKKAKEQAASAIAESDGPRLGDHLGIVDGRFCKTIGPPVPLCNFDARIVEEHVVDDGVEKQRKLIIAGTLEDGTVLPRVTLEPDDLADSYWAFSNWGNAAKIASRGGVIDDLRLAIQMYSNPTVRTTYSHTGWRHLADATGTEGGVPVFLTANGAIGATGVSVDLPDRLAYYALPAEPADVAEAVRTSLKLLELGPTQVMIVLLAMTYRAPLQSILPADFSTFLVAKSGSLKTTVAKLAAAHFGEGLADAPITSFEASVASIEMVLHRLKDVLALVDDFKPASTNPKDEHQVKARHVFGSIGNQEGRGRMRADGSVRQARPPRALVIATGETMPTGESTVARLLPVPLSKGSVNMAKLSAAQANVEALPHAMAAYIDYLRPRLSDFKPALKKRHGELRERFRKIGQGAHPRSPNALAHAALGLDMLRQFATDVGALTSAAAKDLEHEGLKQLEALCTDAKDLARETDPVQRFLDFLRGLINQGKLVLEADPSKPLVQRRDKDAVIGDPIGWCDDDNFYFLEAPTYAAVVRAMESAREPMPLGERALWRRLREQDLIEKGDRDDRLTQRVNLGGRRVPVIVMRKAALHSDTDGPAGGGGGGGAPTPAAPTGSDFGAFVTDRAIAEQNRTTGEANRTSNDVAGSQPGESQPTDTPPASVETPVPPGPVGTVGTVDREEKSREDAGSRREQEETHHVGDGPLPPLTGPTGPTVPRPGTTENHDAVVGGAGSAAARRPDQPDQTPAPRLIVADGLAYLRHRGAPPAGIFCLRTAKRLLGDGTAGPGDYHRTDELEGRLRDAGLAGVAELEFDLLPVVAAMEKAGIGVDIAAWGELVRQAEAHTAEQRATLATLGLAEPDDDAHVHGALTSRGVAVSSTSWKTLAPHMTDPLVAALVGYRRSAGFLNSTGRGVLEAASRDGGRVHAKFDPLAAPTGRMSCSKPNLLSVPKDPAYRRCFVPAPGHLLVVADYAAIELRVLAEFTQDPALTKVFAEGGDPHAATAAALLGKPVDDVSRDERQRAKAVNFGFAFGMGPAKFLEYAYGNYGLAFTRQEAEATRAAFVAAYPGVANWQRRTRAEMPLEARSASGRRRVFASKAAEYCERLNTPVQGTAADGLKLAMVLLDQRLRGSGGRIVLAVHDELLMEAPEDHAGDVRALVEGAMVDGMQRFVCSVPIKVEASVRRNWAEPVDA